MISFRGQKVAQKQKTHLPVHSGGGFKYG